MYWTPQRVKELKEKGYKLKFYVYDPKFKDLTFEEIDSMCGFFRKVHMLFPDKPMIKKMTSWYITLLINDLGEEEQKEIRDKLRAVK